MSWGERSCLKPCRVPDKCSDVTCNVECPGYIHDGVTKPDSVKLTNRLVTEMSKGKPLNAGMNRAERRAMKRGKPYENN